MVSQKYKLPHLLHHFFLPYWQLSSQWRTMMKSKPGAATSIKCCQIQMDLVLSIHFTSSQDCFRSVNCQHMVVCLKPFAPAFKTILPLHNFESHRIMVARKLRKQIKSRQKKKTLLKECCMVICYFSMGYLLYSLSGVILLTGGGKSSKNTSSVFSS